MILLSAVIPIGPNFSDFESMREWLFECKTEGVEAIIVKDSFSRTNNQLFDHVFSAEITNQSIVILEGQFNSPGLARNYGLEEATGEWIIFWDADDLPRPRNVILEVSHADTKIDAIVGQFSINNLPWLSRNIRDLAFNPGNWRVAYRRDFIGKTRFKKYLWGEDQLFIIESGLIDARIQFSHLDFYSYQVGTSIQLTSIKKNSDSLKSVLMDAHSIICGKKRRSDTTIALLIMVIRMSLTAVSKTCMRNKIASIWLVMRINVASLSRFRMIWIQAFFEVVKRKVDNE